LLGDPEVQTGAGGKGFKGAMKTFDSTRPIVAASAIGIGRAAFEFTRDTLAKEGVKMEYGKPRWKLTTVQADLLEMEAQLKRSLAADGQGHGAARCGEENKLESSMAKVKAGKRGHLDHAEGGRTARPARLQHRTSGRKSGCATPRSTTSTKAPGRSTR
jgi:acyl-CoA dehydrogenase